MKTGNIGIRNLADIGIGDIDVYVTGTKRGTSSTTPKLLMFFRSENQAKGKPYLEETGNTYENGTKEKKVTSDNKYDQSFGFDIFNERLYGYDTDVFNEPEFNNIANSNRKKLVSYYEKTNLSLELKDNKSYYIDYNYKLSKKNVLKDNIYYAPNLLIKPNKEVKLYAKFFDTDSKKNLNITVYFKLSGNKGIESFTTSIIFNENEEIKEFKIKTKANEIIDTKIIITAYIKDISNKEIEIGRLTILPNSLYQPKMIFVDVFCNKNTLTTNNNYVNIIDEINQKAMNQSGIQLKIGANKILNVLQTDTLFEFDLSTYTYINKDPLSKYIKQNVKNLQYESYQIDSVLYILKSKFFESIANEIIIELETEFRNLDFKIGNVTKKLLSTNQSLKDLFNLGIELNHYAYYYLDDKGIRQNKKITVSYSVLFAFLNQYINNTKLNFYPIFYCDNIESVVDPTKPTSNNLSETIAVGFGGSKGLIIPTNSKGKIMSFSHEIGHNFGLGHTFLNPEKQYYNILLNMSQTLENIMDYLQNPESESKSFISYQWEIMRENCSKIINDVSDLKLQIVSINKPNDISMLSGWGFIKQDPQISDDNNKDLKLFSTYLLQILVKSFALNNNIDIIKVYQQSYFILQKILDVFLRKKIF